MPFDGSLAAWLREQRGLPSFPQAVQLIRKIADALQQLHSRQTVYYALNPSNILIRLSEEKPEQFDVRLAQLDIATPAFATFGRNYPANSMLMYMAPEQWTGQTLPATDQYALAILAFELLTGQSPFQGPPAQLMDLHMKVQPAAPSTLNPRIPFSVDAVILSALAKRPEDRFPSVSAFAHSLEQAVHRPEPVAASITGPTADGNLRATLLINSAEAITGALRTITLPQGRRITVAVPEGVHDGQVIRLEGFGAPTPANGTSGALFLTIAVSPTQSLPSRSLSSPTVSNKQTKVLPAPLSSTLTGTKTLAGKTYTTVTHLSPVRKATLLAIVVVVLALLGFGLFSLLQTGPTVAIPYPPNSGSLALNDLLQNNNAGNGWPVSTNSNGSACQFTQNAYHVSMTQIGSFNYCIADSPAFSNFAYEVRMTITQGDGGGVIFRANGTQNKFYYFRIGRDGSYGLDLYTDSKHVQTLASGVTPAVHTGLNVPNLLAVVARGNTIALYVNDQQVTSVHDSTYSSGQIGVAAASITSLTEVVFSNAKVWTL